MNVPGNVLNPSTRSEICFRGLSSLLPHQHLFFATPWGHSHGTMCRQMGCRAAGCTERGIGQRPEPGTCRVPTTDAFHPTHTAERICAAPPPRCPASFASRPTLLPACGESRPRVTPRMMGLPHQTRALPVGEELLAGARQCHCRSCAAHHSYTSRSSSDSRRHGAPSARALRLDQDFFTYEPQNTGWWQSWAHWML
jgi:hypothetical protein